MGFLFIGRMTFVDMEEKIRVPPSDGSAVLLFSCLPGEGRDPFLPLAPAFAGVTGLSSPEGPAASGENHLSEC
jgi:hypothetical protein